MAWQGPLAVLTLTLWLALDWADDLFGAVGANGIPGAGIVKNVIRFLGNLILGLINLAVGVLKPFITDAWRLLAHTADLAAEGIHFVDVKFSNGLRGLFDTAYGWVLEAIHYGEGLVAQAVRNIVGWATEAIGYVGDTLAALNRDVLQPLFTFAHQGFAWITGTLIPDVETILGAAIRDVESEAHHIEGDVTSILDKLGNTVDRWLPVIEKAWGWLVVFASNPLEGFIGLWHDVTTLSGESILAGITSAIDQNGEALEDWIVQWLGG